VQARVGDYLYLGKPITAGGQVAHAITMHLFAQALPGAPQQQSQGCQGHACNSPAHPGYVILADINKPCPGAAPMALMESIVALSSPSKGKLSKSRKTLSSRVATNI
jgi:hypothetical protein